MATPATPSRLLATAFSTTEIDLAWACSGANTSQYKVERSLNGSTWVVVATVAVTVTAYRDTNLVANTLYYYRVRGYDGVEEYGSYTSSATATTHPLGTVDRFLKWITTARAGDSNLAEAITGAIGTIAATLTGNRIWTFPNVAGSVALGAGSVTTSSTNDVSGANHTHALTTGVMGIMKQTEIDFGSTPVESADFTVTDADVTTASNIIAQLAYVAPTGKDLDELEFDVLDFRSVAGTGSFTLHARSLEGYVAGTFKVNYSFNKA